VKLLTLFTGLVITALAATGCKKTDADTDAGNHESKKSESNTENPLAPKIPAEWSLEKSLPVVKADTGNKTPYNCFVYSESSYDRKDVAADIPQLGIKRNAENEVIVLATSEAVAIDILNKAFIGPTWIHGQPMPEEEHLRVKGCHPLIASSGAKASDKPLDQYETVTDALQSAYYYYALKGGPIPYEKIANEFFSDYRSEADAFKKHDLLVSATSQINAGVAKAKENPYIHLTMNGNIGAYDFAKSSYALASLVGPRMIVTLGHSEHTGGGEQSTSNNSYQVRFNAAPKFLTFKPADENDARALEGNLAKHSRNVIADVYGKAQRADEINGQPYVLVDLTQVEVRPGNSDSVGPPLFSISN
jgi:hypothetical protein